MSQPNTAPLVGARHSTYQQLIPQIKALVAKETDTIAVMGNLVAALQTAFNFFWVGFYIVRKDTLCLGPFQGPVACMRIAKGQGVCGTAWQEKKSIIVPDVAAWKGHIACNPLSRSEIVVPYVRKGITYAVLDIDSRSLNDFDDTDAKGLHCLLEIGLLGLDFGSSVQASE